MSDRAFDMLILGVLGSLALASGALAIVCVTLLFKFSCQ